MVKQIKEAREVAERRTAIRKALQEEGLTRSTFYREEDYVAYDTRVTDMEDAAFVIFWLTYVYGGEIFEPFERVGGHAGFEYLWRGTIVRRSPGPSSDPTMVEPVIVVDLDKCSGTVQVPREVWQYTFESHAGERVLDLNPAAAKNENKVFRNQASWCPPKTQVHVVLASARAGLLIKGPVTLLLVLAQEKIPLETLGPDDADSLAEAWAQVWALQARCTTLRPKRAGEEVLSECGITLEFPKARVLQLAKTYGANLFLFYFVNEAWMLVSDAIVFGRGKATAESMTVAGVLPTITDDLARDTPYANGQSFAWVPFLRQDCELSLQREWLHTPRIARCKQLGEKYYLNVRYGATTLPPTVTWEHVERMGFLKPRLATVRPARFGAPGEPFLLRAIIAPELSGVLASLTKFAEFWVQIFHRSLMLVEHRDGWFLFRDREAVNAGGDAEIRETDVIVKDVSLPGKVKPYCGGLQGYLDLFSQNGYPTRWFIFDPQNECVEREATVLRSILHGQVGSGIAKVDSTIHSLLRLREETRLNVDVRAGDLLGNVAVSSSANLPEGVQSVVNAWKYDPARGYYPLLADATELARVQEFAEKIQSGAYKKENPLLWCAQVYAFAANHPEEYKRLMTEVEKSAAEAGLVDETNKPGNTGDPDPESNPELFEDEREVREHALAEEEEEDADDFDWEEWWENDPFGDAWLSEDAEPGEETVSWAKLKEKEKAKASGEAQAPGEKKS